MNREQRIKSIIASLLEDERWKANYREKNKIEFFTKPKPEGMPANPLQDELLEAWENPAYKVFTYSGANRCLGAEQLIYDPVEKRSVPVSKLPKRFHVYALDGERMVICDAENPFRKGPVEPLYEATFSSGRKVICSAGHQFLTPKGYSALSELSCGSQLFYNSPIEECVQSTHVAGDYHLNQKGLNWKGGCLGNFYRDDERPQMDINIGQASFPLRGDVQEHNGHYDNMDDWVNRQEHTHQHQVYDHLSILGAHFLNGAHYVEFLYRVFCKCVKRVDVHIQWLCQPVYALSVQLQPIAGFDLSANHVFCKDYNRDSFSPPILNKLTSKAIITSITYLRNDYKWDFTVPGYNNYLAGGVINHNTGKTTVGAIISHSTLFGKWLWNDRKLHFPHNKPRKVRLIGQDWHNQIEKVVIPQLRKWWPESRLVERKGNGIIVDTSWLDKKTGSTLEVLSNMQDPDVHEGWEGDLIVYDEPPKRTIRVANARGLIDRRGRELFCMTLLKEAWVDREVIKARNEDGTPDRSVFNVYGDIYSNVGFGITVAGVEQFAKTLTEDEKDARLKGIPSYMSGIIYSTFNRKLHLKKRFKIPLDWVIDIAIDTHPRERQAILFIATSPRGDKYVCDEIWDNGDGTWIGNEIIRYVQRNVYRVNENICDPLAKGDKNEPNTTFDKIDTVLGRYGYVLNTANKDQTAGILAVKDHLVGPNNEPSIFFFDDLRRTVWEIEGYMWDEETQKPKATDNHMMENLYRLLLLNTKYVEPEEEEDRDFMDSPAKSTASSWTGY